ncbi:MAG: hypothetical protein RL154_411 [Pseudomonadota bacterium]
MEVLFSALVGILAGTMSGFFGVGGGTITVPLLSYFDFNIKAAIGISVVQMLCGSIFGSFLNYKDGFLDVKKYAPFLYGGVFGGLLGSFIVTLVSDKFLYHLFLIILVIATVRVFFSPSESQKPEIYSFWLYLFTGAFTGVMSGMLGVGGAILLTPILVGFFNFSIKNAINVGLFFVIASSFSSLAGSTYFGNTNYSIGLVVALFSLIGVWGGIMLARKTNAKKHKYLLVGVYILTFSILFGKAMAE